MIDKKIGEMEEGAALELDWLRKELRLLRRTSKILFSRAPCMMHMVNAEGRFVKVNQKWLKAMGYEREEVVGRPSFDFLTQESRERAVSEVLPLFWRVGSARSIGAQFETKKFGALPVLMDAETLTDKSRSRFGLAAIYPNEDLSQWTEARKTLGGVSEILGVQSKLQLLLGNGSYQSATSVAPAERHLIETPPAEPLSIEFFGIC